MNSARGFYPVILIPDSIRYFCINNPIPVLNSSSNSVTEFSSETQLPPRKVHIYANFCFYGIIIILVIAIVIVLLVNKLFNLSILAFWSSLICASVSAVTACFYLRFINFKLCDRYQHKLTHTQQQLSKSESHSLPRLQSETQKYHNLLEERSKELLFLLSKIVQPPSNQGNAEVQQGVSEKQFFVYLCRYFSDVYEFCMGVEFPIPGTSLSYTADFILIHQPTGLAIDIEIDEPYDGKTGKPHHCVDQNKDQQRNRFFLDRNWVVIRFSEYQVVKYPEGCCKAIAQVISQITGDHRGLIKLQNIKDLLPHKQWKNKEAVYMARTKFRNSYLRRNHSGI